MCSPAFDLNPNEENVEGAVGAGISKDMNVLDEEMKISYGERDESIGCSCCLVVHRGRRRRLKSLIKTPRRADGEGPCDPVLQISCALLL